MTRKHLIIGGLGLTLVIVTAIAFSGCATNTPPETQVTHYTGTVLQAATELQKGVTAATDAKILPVPLAQTMTGYVQVIHDKSGPLLTSLAAYHAAMTLDLRKIKAMEIQGQIAAINAALGQLLGTAIPEGALKQLSQLVGNVMAAVGAVQAEIAKGLGGS